MDHITELAAVAINHPDLLLVFAATVVGFRKFADWFVPFARGSESKNDDKWIGPVLLVNRLLLFVSQLIALQKPSLRSARQKEEV